MNGTRLLAFVAVCACTMAAYARNADEKMIFNVRAFGAAGDGAHADTKAMQRAIDQCSREGGTVIVPPGTYLVGSLDLKSNVDIEIMNGARILGSTKIADYEERKPKLASYNDIFLRHSIFYAEGAENITIRGQGVIDGQGGAFVVTTRVKPDRYRNRPFVFRFVECKNIRIEGITLKNSAMWMQHYLACDHVTLRRITVYNHANQNNDMVDIDGCSNVVVSDCFGDTDDDALTFKSTTGRMNENITVTNCVLSSHVNAIKFGTETIGGFKNIAVSNITIRPSSKKDVIYGMSRGIGGIVLSMVDGGTLDGITLSNIMIDGVQTPIFMRLGDRGRTIADGMPKPSVGTMKNISISNVIAVNAGAIGSSIHGLPGHPIENVALSNISLSYAGGGTRHEAEAVIPEKEEEYPESSMFGPMPAYGLFIRHAVNVTVNDVRLSFAAGDARPALACDDAAWVEIRGLKAAAGAESGSFIDLRNSRNIMIGGSRPVGTPAVFLSAGGKACEGIRLFDNDYSSTKRIVGVRNGADMRQIFISGAAR